MSKVKKLKVMQPDGQLSDYINIGADAANVDMANGKTVETAVTELENGGFITKDVNDLTNYYNKNDIDGKLTSAMHYKGEVETYSELEALSDNAESGDVYNIKQASEYNNAGDNAVWNASAKQWDVLTGVVDLAGYFNKKDVIPVANGGTGAKTLTAGQVLIGNGTSAVTTKAIDNTAGGTENSTDLITSGAVAAGLKTKVDSSLIGANDGVADLDENGKLPEERLPESIYDCGSVRGEDIVIEHSGGNCHPIDFAIYGNTKQETSVQGNNLFDFKKQPSRQINVTNIDVLDNGLKIYLRDTTERTYIAYFVGQYKDFFGKTLYFKSKVSTDVSDRQHGLFVWTFDDINATQNILVLFELRGNGSEEKDYSTKYTFDVESLKEKYVFICFYAKVDTNTTTSNNYTIYQDIMISENDIEYEPFIPNKPSPNYPSEIENVEGRNLFKFPEYSKTDDLNVRTNASEIYINGKTKGSASYLSAKEIVGKLKPGKYKCICKLLSGDYIIPTGGPDFSIYICKGNANNHLFGFTGNTLNHSIKTTSFTLTEVTTISVYLYVNNKDIEFNDCIIGICLEEDTGGVGAEYLPYQSIGIKLTGENWLNNSLKSQEINGLTVTVNEDKSVLINGTATKKTNLTLQRNIKFSSKAILSGCPDGGAKNKYYMAYSNNVDHAYFDIGDNIEIEQFSETYANTEIDIVILEGTTCSNLLFKPMVRAIDTEDDTYDSYKEKTYPLSLNANKTNYFDITKPFDYGSGANATTVNESNQIVSTANILQVRSLGPHIERLQPNKAYVLSGTLVSTNGTGEDFNAYIEIRNNNSDGTSERLGEIRFSPSISKPYNFYSNFTTIDKTDGIYVSFNGANSSSSGSVRAVFENIKITTPDFILGKINDYQNYIYKNKTNNKWYFHKEIKQIVLTGDEKWELSTKEVENYSSFYVNNFLYAYTNSPIICNYFKYVDYVFWNNNVEDTFISHTSSVNNVVVRLKSSIANTVDDFKQWLKDQYNAGTPVIVQYVLATPVEEEITDETLINQLETIKLLKGYNHITPLTKDVLPELKIDYAKTCCPPDKSDIYYGTLAPTSDIGDNGDIYVQID